LCACQVSSVRLYEQKFQDSDTILPTLKILEKLQKHCYQIGRMGADDISSAQYKCSPACILGDERAVKQAVVKQYPVLKAAIGFEYGYEIMVGVMCNLHFALKCFEYYVEVHKK